ncbi:MAG TPA: alpha/beta fold hydrolase [Actinomycetota bacterium]|nr:alpha/beta fold hydrolase [Actinomycetota bacterium]
MEPMTFATEDGVRLEGELRMPDGTPRGSAVICHAHPRHGGSKDHPVLWAVRNELAGRRGFATLGFNFRGIMGSSGSFGGGRDEIEDVRAAIGFVRERVVGPTLVFGWSFGASVALREAFEDRRVAALALFGLPLRPDDLSLPPLPGASELTRLDRPLLLLAGEHDEYCPADDLRAYAESVAEVVIVEGVDHYLSRRERDAAAIVGNFADRLVSRPSG